MRLVCTWLGGPARGQRSSTRWDVLSSRMSLEHILKKHHENDG